VLPRILSINASISANTSFVDVSDMGTRGCWFATRFPALFDRGRCDCRGMPPLVDGPADGKTLLGCPTNTRESFETTSDDSWRTLHRRLPNMCKTDVTTGFRDVGGQQVRGPHAFGPGVRALHPRKTRTVEQCSDVFSVALIWSLFRVIDFDIRNTRHTHTHTSATRMDGEGSGDR
jgi:hypothetical protein